MFEKEEQKILAIQEIERRQNREGNKANEKGEKKAAGGRDSGGADDQQPQGLEAELSIPASL